MNRQKKDINRCKFRIAILLLTLVSGCGKSKNKIEGTWTYINTIKNRIEVRSPELVENHQIQFLDNGEMKLFHNNKRFGTGFYYYKLKGDSLYWSNIQVDTTGKFDTLATSSALVSIKNDIMSIKYESKKTVYYKREKN